MSSSGSANAQALLQSLCKFMLPLIQTAFGQTTDLNNICVGIEADDFVIELQKFISEMISRSQSRTQDVAMVAMLDEDFHFTETLPVGTNWLWDKTVPEEKAKIGGISNVEVNAEQDSGDPQGQDLFHQSEVDIAIPEDKAIIGASLTDKENREDIIQHPAVPQLIPIGSDEENLRRNLQSLRQYVNQEMPIRLMCFEPHNSKLKISLLDRAGIYNYLAIIFRAEPIAWVSESFFRGWKPAQYAILSHTWTQIPGEMTYNDWKNGLLDLTQPKCRKLVNFCKTVLQNHGLALGWIDTACINKESSAELDESIRSMYAWYCGAEVCITYLAGSKALKEMHMDPWFTRGWTLQELVAPYRTKFYDMGWNPLSGVYNDRFDRKIQAEIKLATTLAPHELHRFRNTSISRRMQLAAKREVTRGEDIAYCLMGIFDVSISTAYGEGINRAFFRLVEEIFRSTINVSDIFNWAYARPGLESDLSSWQPITSLFPFHPANYLTRSSIWESCGSRADGVQ